MVPISRVTSLRFSDAIAVRGSRRYCFRVQLPDRKKIARGGTCVKVQVMQTKPALGRCVYFPDCNHHDGKLEREGNLHTLRQDDASRRCLLWSSGRSSGRVQASAAQSRRGGYSRKVSSLRSEGLAAMHHRRSDTHLPRHEIHYENNARDPPELAISKSDDKPRISARLFLW